MRSQVRVARNESTYGLSRNRVRLSTQGRTLSAIVRAMKEGSAASALLHLSRLGLGLCEPENAPLERTLPAVLLVEGFTYSSSSPMRLGPGASMTLGSGSVSGAQPRTSGYNT